MMMCSPCCAVGHRQQTGRITAIFSPKLVARTRPPPDRDIKQTACKYRESPYRVTARVSTIAHQRSLPAEAHAARWPAAPAAARHLLRRLGSWLQKRRKSSIELSSSVYLACAKEAARHRVAERLAHASCSATFEQLATSSTCRRKSLTGTLRTQKTMLFRT